MKYYSKVFHNLKVEDDQCCFASPVVRKSTWDYQPPIISTAFSISIESLPQKKKSFYYFHNFSQGSRFPWVVRFCLLHNMEDPRELLSPLINIFSCGSVFLCPNQTQHRKGPAFPVYSCQMVCQSFLEANTPKTNPSPRPSCVSPNTSRKHGQSFGRCVLRQISEQTPSKGSSLTGQNHATKLWSSTPKT